MGKEWNVIAFRVARTRRMPAGLDVMFGDIGHATSGRLWLCDDLGDPVLLQLVVLATASPTA